MLSAVTVLSNLASGFDSGGGGNPEARHVTSSRPSVQPQLGTTALGLTLSPNAKAWHGMRGCPMS